VLAIRTFLTSGVEGAEGNTYAHTVHLKPLSGPAEEMLSWKGEKRLSVEESG
jgi:hypothetical protein